MAKPLEKVAAFIVDRRKGFYLIYILLVIFSIFSTGWVKVDNSLTDYLDEKSETRRGLTLMDEEFITYATAEVMVDNISYADAERIRTELEKTEGVKEIAFDDTTAHYNDAAALFSVTFTAEDDDPICESALEEIKNKLSGYDLYVSAELGNTKAETTAAEMQVVMIIACVIIASVLTLTSRTYMEIPVLVITFGMAALLNKGTNFMFGTISFISNSISVVLQLALAIDYAIILCHRYTEERVNLDAREAVIQALCKAIPEISGSCLTTLSGLGAMSFMHFRLGFDMSMVMIKAIIISIITVFTLMPGLLLSFSPLIDKTHHKSFVPKITAWNEMVIKLRYIAPAVFAVMVAICFFLSNACPYVYSYTNLSTIRKNDAQIAQKMINDTFSSENVLAVIIPTGDYEKEQALARELEGFDEVDSVTALASVEAKDGYSVGDMMTPREFAELTDIDVELVRLLYTAYASNKEDYGRIVGGIDDYRIPLVDLFDFAYEMTQEGYVDLDDDTAATLVELNEKLSDGKLQLEGMEHSRLVLNLNLPEESEETFAFLETVRKTAQKYYGEVTLAGNSTNDFDLSSTFSHDNTLISILSILFVMLVLFFTFQSAGVPVILILVIQGSVWVNFSFPTITGTPLFFMSYLIVSSIQMGANIDYAIVITNRYIELRKEMSKIEAIKQSLDMAFPTIFTSGSILAAAGAAIGLMSSEPAISSIGVCLSRGTLISIALVMGVLPQLLILGDFIIEKTSFSIKNIKRSGAAAMAIIVALGMTPVVRAEDGEIVISSRGEFETFAKNCTMDTWSVGKTVVLAADIDMGGAEITPIPTFGGTFDGGGHSLTNISVTKNGSAMGLFRYVREGGEVKDLHVSGSVTPGGSMNSVGGIVGENAGTILNCTFAGAVKGENKVGGIAGRNTGNIISCTASGSVEGQNSTGGIAGENTGCISGCVNTAAVNTSPEEKKRSLDDIDADAGAVVENIAAYREKNEEESVLGHTDTGGIAGHNTGIIEGCKNSAKIGYQHVGYNVGGIAGRQSGYILGCENSEEIFGRKDVGGIVGQAEPYITLSVSDTTLAEVRSELNALSTAIDGFISKTKNLTSDAGGRFDTIKNYAETAAKSAETMSKEARKSLDDNVSEINALSSSLSNAVGDVADSTDGLTSASGYIENAMDDFSKALDTVEIEAPELQDVKTALDEIKEAEGDMSRARSKARSALRALENAVRVKNTADERKALESLSGAIKEAASAKQSVKTALEAIDAILKSRPESFEGLLTNVSDAAREIENAVRGLGNCISALGVISDSIDALTLNTELDLNPMKKSARLFGNAVDSLGDAMADVGAGISSLSGFVDSASDEMNGKEGEINRAKDFLSGGFKKLSYAFEDIGGSIGEASDIISNFASENNPQFIMPGEDFRKAGDGMLESFNAINDELSELYSLLDENTGDDDLHRINAMLKNITELAAGELDEINGGRETERFVDASEENIENSVQGKVGNCENNGAINGDRNVGGIAGALAIEYARDPEDEIEKPDALNFTYTTKAILAHCVNDGVVTGKKDCVGGVVGLADIGTVYKCESYALAQSASGEYVGGIAGRSDAPVRRCYSKAEARGKNYVGGICGRGEKLSGCVSLSDVSGDECAGAVLGDCGDREGARGNYFIDRGLGGIDGISYAGCAEPIEYDALALMEGVPERLISFSVKFIADGKVVDEQEIKYGSDTGRIVFPPVPEKDGFFGNWQEIEEKIVSADIEVLCEYKENITVISSPEKSDGLSIALAEGEFTDKAEIHAEKGNDDVYNIKISDVNLGEADRVVIRLLKPKDKKFVGWAVVQVKTESGWRNVKTKTRGSYLIFEAPSPVSEVRIVSKGLGGILPIIVLILLALLMALCVILIILRRKKVKKRT